MQAPLSSTASGKQFHTGPSNAVLPCFSAVVPLEPFARRHAAGGASLLPFNSNLPLSEGAGLAHDAGNLLHALGLYCELLSAPGVLREEHRHYADELQLISRRSRSMMARLLDPVTTGRYDERSLMLPDVVIVPEVIEQCRGLLDTIARRVVDVAYETGASLPVALSRESLERILVNLTKNAAEAGSGVAPVAISLRVSCLRAVAGGAATAADRIVLSIEDKGRGMSSAAVKVLLGEGVAQSGTHGIGFRVVRELVGASGGRLKLRSKSGCGTVVEISWMVAGSKPMAVAASMQEDARPFIVAKQGGSSRRVSC